jgi:hypothetical protein
MDSVFKRSRWSFPAFAPQCIEETTRSFIDLVVARLLMRAIVGEDLAALRAEIPTHLPRSVAFLLTAWRS